MEVRKDFAARVQAMAASTPREAIANLLSALMPREPVATRPAAPVPSAPAPAAPPSRFGPKRGTRTRRAAIDYKTLTVVSPGNPYRAGTKAAQTFDLFRQYDGSKVYTVKFNADSEKHDMGYLNYASRDGYITLT